MNIYLKDAIAGDRFVDPRTGTGWNVLWNRDGYVKMVSDTKVMHEGHPPVDMVVTLTNRGGHPTYDESLTHGQALSNIIGGGLTGTVISTS